MAEILSQSEIDELLAALISGNDPVAPEPDSLDASGPAAKPYNFRTANKFSKEQIRMLHVIYDNYAGRLETVLSGVLRCVCEASVISVEEQTFGEYSNSLPTPVFLGIFEMPPLAGSCLIEFSSTVCYEIITRLFGGRGELDPEPNKSYTEIEVAILNRVIQQMISTMDGSWARIAQTRTVLDRVETSAQFAQIVASSEPIIIITMNLIIGDSADIINICLPHLAIQPIAKSLATATWYNNAASTAIALENLNITNVSPRINQTYVTMRTLFEPTIAPVRDVISIQEGDVIRLDHPIDQDVTILVEHIAKFKGRIGLKDKHLAIKVTDILKEVAEDE